MTRPRYSSRSHQVVTGTIYCPGSPVYGSSPLVWILEIKISKCYKKFYEHSPFYIHAESLSEPSCNFSNLCSIIFFTYSKLLSCCFIKISSSPPRSWDRSSAISRFSISRDDSSSPAFSVYRKTVRKVSLVAGKPLHFKNVNLNQ